MDPAGAPTEGSEPTAATAPLDQEAVAATLAAVEADLAAVDDSLRRLDDGTYGRCDVCGGPVEDTVLAATPTARTCAEHRA